MRGLFGISGSTRESLKSLHGLVHGMGISRKREPDITVREFGRIEDHIEAEIQRGRREFCAVPLAEATDLSVPKIYEALQHLEQKHAYFSDLGAGQWRIEEPE